MVMIGRVRLLNNFCCKSLLLVSVTSNKDLQRKLLSNRTLPIITTKICPQIGDRVATSGASPHKLATPQKTEVITDAACSSAWILRNPRCVSRTERGSATPGDCDIFVRFPWAQYPVLGGGIGVPPTRGHSGGLEVLNERPSTYPSVSRNNQNFNASVDRKLDNGGYSTSFLSS